MFTGIIQAVGKIIDLQECKGDVRLQIETGKLPLDDIQPGDSIACSGVCLTVVDLGEDHFWADVSRETLDNTTIAHWKVGGGVNLEKALTPASRLGGHIVSGHVDGVGEVIQRTGDARSERFRCRAPAALAKYIAQKGSVAIDGVSLTVNKVDGAEFDINIVPHTLANTVIGAYQAGTKVNLEVDVIARYLERLLQGDSLSPGNAAEPAGSGITLEFLAEHGFYKDSERSDM